MWRREGFATASVAGAIAREGTPPSYVSPIGMDWNVWSISESRQLMNRQAQLVVDQLGVERSPGGTTQLSPPRERWDYVPAQHEAP
jgi:hypothetical protein